ncbi:MAG TPA: histidine kinase [Pseudonocardiaceae bacterium]|nr:histidine kinase [Pseudonocardiaceae bacterium]
MHRARWPAASVSGPALGALAGGLAAVVGVLASAKTRLDPWQLWLPMQAVGLSFTTAGVIAWLRRPGNGAGRLMVAVGVVWYVMDLRASTQPALFAVGFSLFYLTPVVLTHLVLALPGGRLRRWPERLVAAGLYATVLVTQPPRYLVEHPRPPQSWTSPTPAYSAWAYAGSVAGLALTVASLVLVLRRWRMAGRPTRRTHALVWIAGTAVGLTVLVTILASMVNAAEEAMRPLAIVYTVGLVFIPFAILAGVLRVRIARIRVADLVLRLEATTEPAELSAALGDALGDPTLRVCFRRPDGGEDAGGYVDAEGRPVRLPDGGDRAVTFVRRQGGPLAALVHDPALHDQRPLVDAVVAATRLALENARLHAAQRAQLQEVRASRARIIAAADAERHRIQRDLHDGAQHKLLAISMLVSRVKEELPAGAGRSAGLLEAAGTRLHEVIRELRELTEGIHPPALTEQGLGAVLESLAERAPIPVRFAVPPGRWPKQAERTAYFVINEALANIYKHAGASRATVCIRGTGRILAVQVVDDGAGGADPDRGTGLRGLRDRVAAIGGSLRISSPAGMGTRIEAELPCGS